MNNDARANRVLSILSKIYPRAKIVLSYGSPWELLIAVILSAQCTDKTVNKVTKTLFKEYPTLESYCRADLSTFEQHIKSTGFYHNKAKNILNAARRTQSDFHGVVPKTMNDLLTLPGVARKTANVVLGNAFGVVEGIAVDTHVLRLSQRLRLVPLNTIGGKNSVFVYKKTGGEFPGTPSSDRMRTIKSPYKNRVHQASKFFEKDSYGDKQRTSDGEETRQDPLIDYLKDASPEKIEAELMKVIPKKHWFSLTYQLIDHGRALCKAQNPNCKSCPLSPYCPVRR